MLTAQFLLPCHLSNQESATEECIVCFTELSRNLLNIVGSWNTFHSIWPQPKSGSEGCFGLPYRKHHKPHPLPCAQHFDTHEPWPHVRGTVALCPAGKPRSLPAPLPSLASVDAPCLCGRQPRNFGLLWTVRQDMVYKGSVRRRKGRVQTHRWIVNRFHTKFPDDKFAILTVQA